MGRRWDSGTGERRGAGTGKTARGRRVGAEKTPKEREETSHVGRRPEVCWVETETPEALCPWVVDHSGLSVESGTYEGWELGVVPGLGPVPTRESGRNGFVGTWTSQVRSRPTHRPPVIRRNSCLAYVVDPGPRTLPFGPFDPVRDQGGGASNRPTVPSET